MFVQSCVFRTSQSFEYTVIGVAECYGYHVNIMVYAIKIQVDSSLSKNHHYILL